MAIQTRPLNLHENQHRYIFQVVEDQVHTQETDENWQTFYEEHRTIPQDLMTILERIIDDIARNQLRAERFVPFIDLEHSPDFPDEFEVLITIN